MFCQNPYALIKIINQKDVAAWFNTAQPFLALFSIQL